jgi:DNA-binding transcriptional LysR family regulator
MDKFKAMQVFVRIAEEGSLTRAAQALGSSLPAVVRSLAAYEAALGVRLFHRTTRRIALTEEGREHLERTRGVLAALQDAEDALGERGSAPAGHLHITAPVLFGQMYIAPAITRFVQENPGLHCSVSLLDRVVNLVEEGMDLGVRIGRLQDSTLVSQPLGEIRRVVVAAPALLRRHGPPAHPRDLARAKCVRMLFGPPTFGDFQEGGKVFRVPVTGNLAFNHVWPAVQACAEGAGFGMFFSYQVAPLVADKRLTVILDDFELPARPISIVYPHARLLPARTKACIAYLRAQVTQFRHG